MLNKNLNHYRTYLSGNDWLPIVENETIKEDIYNQNLGIKSLSIFANNPYRILGIPANTSCLNANKHYDKLLKKAKLNIKTTTDFDLNILGNINRNLEDLYLSYNELQNELYSLIWFNDSFYTKNISDESTQEKVFLARYNMNAFKYDDFLSTFINIILNDPLCYNIYHWLYLLRLVGIMSSLDSKYLNKILEDRNILILRNFTDEEIIQQFLAFYLDPITKLIKTSIQKSNLKTTVNWFYILQYSFIKNKTIENLMIEIKDFLEDVSGEIKEDLDKLFKDVTISMTNNNSKFMIKISIEKIKNKLDTINSKLEKIFDIIPSSTQKGKRIRKPLYEILIKVANAYLINGFHTESDLIYETANLCYFE